MNKLSQACELSLNDWLATFPDEIPEAECSAKHEKWKKNLFNKMRDDYYHKFTTKTIKIMLIAAILCALLMTAFVFPSSREFIHENFDRYSMYKITESNKNSLNGKLAVGYIPEGFELEGAGIVDKIVLFKYKDENGELFTVSKSASSMEIYYDTENFVSEEIIYNNVTYIYCQDNENINNLIWIKNDYAYRIDGTLSKEELLEIAKNVN